MDRTPPQRSRQLVLPIALSLIAWSGQGCSRLKSYRAQDSPLDGLPLIGRKARGQAKPASELAANSQASRTGDVAWSGDPNDAPPLAGPGPARALRGAPQLARNAPARLVSNPAESGGDERQPADPGLAKVRSLVQAGRDRLAKVGTYQVAMNRQERVGESLQPAENVVLSIRRQPRAVRLEWPDGPHKGREVIYAADAGGMMHINMADSKIPMPRMSLAPDSPMVMKNSRHPITEAGLDAILDRLDSSLKPHEDGTAGTERLVYKGMVTPPETGRPCHEISRATVKGEIWVIDLDAESGLPALVRETAANGDLLEKYVFRDLVTDPPALTTASSFDPDARWGKPRSLLGRFAQGGAAATPAVR